MRGIVSRSIASHVAVRWKFAVGAAEPTATWSAEKGMAETEGIAAAKARGVHCGRKRIHVPDGFVDIAAQWENGDLSATAAAAELGMSRDTFLRRASVLHSSGAAIRYPQSVSQSGLDPPVCPAMACPAQMASTMYGYARVSTQVQNEARQLAALREFGVAEENALAFRTYLKNNMRRTRVCFKTIKVTKRGYRQGKQPHGNRELSSRI